jgi:tagatose 6-phosphate kinase
VILCVCLSPAIDVTYRVDRLVPGATVRVGGVDERPGGKAVNVARVLHALHEPVLLVAPVGGETGEELRRELAGLGIPSRLVPDASATRRTVTTVDDAGQATCLVEPAAITSWPEILTTVEDALADARALVVSGGMPSGVPPLGLTALVRAAKARGVPVLADTHGPALLEAVEAGCDVIKPNADELAQVCGDDDPLRAARELTDRSGTVVVVSRGGEGVVATTPHGTSVVRPVAAVAGNPTGAGDALVAGLARALARDPAALHHPEDVLRAAVALSVAAVHSPAAGEVDLAAYDEALGGITVTTLDGVG